MLKVNNLVSGYSESNFFLQDISFNVRSGELICIIGPNGSGKSTLLKSISRVLAPKSGNILFKNKNIGEYTYRELAQKIAVVTQQSNDNLSGLIVSEYILLGRIPYRNRFQLLESKHDLKIAEDTMKSTDILSLKNRDISHLSGGEKQRAIVARALCQEPELLLLDEPTSHLDIGHQVETLDLLKKLNKNGLTIIMVLHDLNLASLYCNRLILLNKGAICSIGTPEDIIKKSIIEKVYNTPVAVEKNPINSKPLVCLVSKE